MKAFYSTQIPKIAGPDLSMESLQSGSENPKEVKFTDPYGKFALNYDSSWTQMDKTIVDKAKALANSNTEELLLFASKVNLANMMPSYLVIERLNFSNWDSVFAETQKDAETSGRAIETIKTETDGTITRSEFKLVPKEAGKQNSGFHYLETIIVDGDKSYLVSISTAETGWLALATEADAITGSIKLTQATVPPEQPAAPLPAPNEPLPQVKFE